MQTLGLRHVALNVKNAQISKNFYTELFGMTLEWEPDPKNVYLTSQGQDNLALHENPNLKLDASQQSLDHIGFAMRSPADVDKLYDEVVAHGVVIVAKPKQHRDGAYSFYMRDPDGYVVQLIYHPPIAKTCS